MKDQSRLRKKWTPEEDEYLASMHGSFTPSDIATRLKRTESAVRKRMRVLRLGYANLNHGLMSLNDIAIACNTPVDVVKRWVKKLRLPTKKLALYEHRTFIDPKSFWKWAEKNKDVIRFARIERLSIIPEPDWVEHERTLEIRGEVRRKCQIKHWTREEEDKAWYLYHKLDGGMKAVAKELGRTESSVAAKIKSMRQWKKK